MQHSRVATGAPSIPAQCRGLDGVGDPAVCEIVCSAVVTTTVTTVTYSNASLSRGTSSSHTQAFPVPPGWPHGGHFMAPWQGYPPGYFPYPYPQGQGRGNQSSTGQEYFFPAPYFGGFAQGWLPREYHPHLPVTLTGQAIWATQGTYLSNLTRRASRVHPLWIWTPLLHPALFKSRIPPRRM